MTAALCGATFFGMGPACARAAGHAGEHQDGIGAAWGSAPLVRAETGETWDVERSRFFGVVILYRVDAPAARCASEVRS